MFLKLQSIFFFLTSNEIYDSFEMFAGILHTIMFHRALGLVRPKDVDLELFDITYVSHKLKSFI